MLLRPVRSTDADRLLEILGEPEVARWWGTHDANRVREDLIEPADEVAYAIESGGELIGAVTYYEEPAPDYRHAGLDIFLTTDRHGQGLGSETLRLLARHLFDERGHHRLTIDPATANHRAIRAYEKVGFRPVGVMREYERGPDGTWHDGLLMDLLAAELPTAEDRSDCATLRAGMNKRRYFVVIREPGHAWDASRSMREQDGWEPHAAFMDALAEEGFIVLGGPLGDGRRALHVVDAESKREIEGRLAEDPWSKDLLAIASIEPWTILLEAS